MNNITHQKLTGIHTDLCYFNAAVYCTFNWKKINMIEKKMRAEYKTAQRNHNSSVFKSMGSALKLN